MQGAGDQRSGPHFQGSLLVTLNQPRRALAAAALSGKRWHQGASIVEMMVAVLLLAVGIVAMVGIHASALKYTKTSQFRTTASEVATAFGEAVRANVPAAINGNYNVANAGGAIVMPANLCNTAAPCTAVQMAQLDLAMVRSMARNTLTNGDIVSNVTAVPGTAPTVALWVVWSGPATARAADDPDGAWAQTQEGCPPNAPDIPGRQCMFFTIPL